jgi:predicted RNA-binding protein with PIN domain
MPYLIDGHNLIPKIPGLSLKTLDDEIQLIERLQEYCRKSGKKAEVYFDNAAPGQAGSRVFGRVKAYFISAGRTADDAIIARLRGMRREAKNWQVISSDRQVAAAARSFHAQVISSDEFARRMQSTASEEMADPGVETDPALDPEEVEAWLDLFSDRNDYDVE